MTAPADAEPAQANAAANAKISARRRTRCSRRLYSPDRLMNISFTPSRFAEFTRQSFIDTRSRKLARLCLCETASIPIVCRAYLFLMSLTPRSSKRFTNGSGQFEARSFQDHEPALRHGPVRLIPDAVAVARATAPARISAGRRCRGLRNSADRDCEHVGDRLRMWLGRVRDLDRDLVGLADRAFLQRQGGDLERRAGELAARLVLACGSLFRLAGTGSVATPLLNSRALPRPLAATLACSARAAGASFVPAGGSCCCRLRADRGLVAFSRAGRRRAFSGLRLVTSAIASCPRTSGRRRWCVRTSRVRIL